MFYLSIARKGQDYKHRIYIALNPGLFAFFGIPLHGLDGRIDRTCVFSGFNGQVSSFSKSPEYLLDSLITDVARGVRAISCARALSSSV